MIERAILDDNKKGTYNLQSLSCTYSQEPDTNSPDDEWQFIKFETISNGMASYINISLPEGGHWSIDSPTEFAKLLDDFKSRYEQLSDEELKTKYNLK